MMGNRHEFDFQQFGQITNSQFTLAQSINDSQTERFAESLELIRAELRRKGLLVHDEIAVSSTGEQVRAS